MLVTIEGIDGSGKTTLLQGNQEIDGLRSAFPEAVYTTEPNDDTWLGEAVRKAISNDAPQVPPMSILFLFLSEHANHIEDIVNPALQNDQLVICDRYIDSRYAYQTYEIRDIIETDTLEWIRGVQETGWAPIPELTLLLDIPAETSLERSDGDEIFEKQERLEYYRDTYLQLAEELDRYTVIDGTQPIGEMVEEAVTAINNAQSNH